MGFFLPQFFGNYLEGVSCLFEMNIKISYEELREWRDICEYLDNAWYKFIGSHVTQPSFSLLTKAGESHRRALWSSYMIQFVKWGSHPHSFYRQKSIYRKDSGWRLLPCWEMKIDFLEQIFLFGRNPDDLPQPWKQEIWTAFFKKREEEIDLARSYQERMEEVYRSRLIAEEKLKAGDCPVGFSCKNMTGSFSAGDCLNFTECRSLRRGI
jgi:hypothetical protein